jgi:hypothetical protein
MIEATGTTGQGKTGTTERYCEPGSEAIVKSVQVAREPRRSGMASLSFFSPSLLGRRTVIDSLLTLDRMETP